MPQGPCISSCGLSSCGNQLSLTLPEGSSVSLTPHRQQPPQSPIPHPLHPRGLRGLHKPSMTLSEWIAMRIRRQSRKQSKPRSCRMTNQVVLPKIARDGTYCFSMLRTCFSMPKRGRYMILGYFYRKAQSHKLNLKRKNSLLELSRAKSSRPAMLRQYPTQ